MQCMYNVHSFGSCPYDNSTVYASYFMLGLHVYRICIGSNVTLNIMPQANVNDV